MVAETHCLHPGDGGDDGGSGDDGGDGGGGEDGGDDTIETCWSWC